MNIEETIQNVSNLARVGLNAEEIKAFGKQLSDVLSYIEIVQSVELPDVEHDETFINQVRSDEANNPIEREVEGIKNLFPRREGDYNKVQNIMAKK